MNLLKIENLKKIIFIFLLTFPIFDSIIFYNSITTLIRVILIILCFMWLLYKVKESRKTVIPITIYLITLGIYFLIHHFNALNFKSLVPDNFNYNIVREFLYFLKLSMPVFIIPILIFIQLEKKKYQQILCSWIIFISGSIVFTNLFQISYGSYSNEPIAGNIISWFFLKENGYTYYDLASKGFFMYANQISTLLILILPCMFLLLKKNTSTKNIIYLGVLSLSMIMIGTRIASILGIILLFLCLIAYFFFVIIKKEKINKKLIITTTIIIACSGILLPFSPSVNRVNVMDSIEDSTSMVKPITTLVMNGGGHLSFDKIDYIENNYEEKRIAKQFILEAYPYQYDPDFWYRILSEPVEKRIDYRYLEIEMVKRVVEINDNKLDKWLGITNTRIQNIFNIERDFVLQYYAFGIIGSILIFLPYMIIGLILIKKWIKNFNLEISIGIGIFLLYFICSLLSGNNLNHLSTIIPFLVIISYFFIDFKKLEK